MQRTCQEKGNESKERVEQRDDAREDNVSHERLDMMDRHRL